MFRKIFLILILGLSLPTHSWGVTHYVKIGGSDGAAGTSWATAWATMTKVNSSTSSGDTTYFGTGTWRGRLVPVSGTSGDRTTYACSSFVQGIARIWASDSVTGWIQHSGSVYKAKWTPTSNYENDNAYVCGQNDATRDTFLIYSSSIPSVEGRFYYNTSTDTIYVWCWGGGDPSTKDIEPSCKPAVYFGSGQDYVTIWGFDLRYGKLGTVLFMSSACTYNQIEHCKIYGVGYINQENASCVFAAKFDNQGNQGRYNVVRACSLGFSFDPNMDAWRFGIGMYSQSHFLAESCVVVGGVVDGIDLKSGNIIDSSTVRFNTIRGCSWLGIVLHNETCYDSVYGNIIIGTGQDNGMQMGIESYSAQGYGGSGTGLFVANNTIYAPRWTGFHSGTEGNVTPPNWFKYNIVSNIYNPTNWAYDAGNVDFVSGDSAHWTLDSNLYYPTTSFGIRWGSRTLTYWQNTLGLDVHSTFANPGFANPAGGDFSRPSSSQEMNLTYGGKTWTRYGAWQPSGSSGGDTYPPDTVRAVDTTQVNTTSVLLRCHRNDSTDCVGYRVKYSQGSTAPANVNSGTYGDSSDANGRNDTLFTVSGLTSNTQYSFSVFAKDEVSNWSVKGSGSWKTVTTDLNPDITPPDTVKGVDTTQVTANRVYLVCHKVDSSDCGGYMVRYNQGATAPSVYNAGTFGDSTSSRNDTTFVVSGLSSGIQYSFTIFARDEVPNWTTRGSQSWVTVTTHGENHCPSSPALNLPVDGDTILGVNPTLNLNNSSDLDPGDVLVYDFQVYTDSQLVNVAANVANVAQGQSITSWQVNPELPDESWYWWRARSYDSMCHSDWSGSRKFYVKRWIADVGDSQPVLKSPADGAVLTTIRPTLEVYSITGFVSLLYYFQIDSDSQFASPVQSEAVTGGDVTTDWTVPNLLSAGNYCWRVRALDGSELSMWSDIGKFSLVPQIYAYPNPFKSSAGDQAVVFNNIPVGSNIKITTLSGETVKKFANTQDSQIIWNAKNQKNEDVASGVYFYFIDFAGGSTSGKIVIIR